MVETDLFRFAAPQDGACPVTAVAEPDLEALCTTLAPDQAAWIARNGFTAAAGSWIALPGPGGELVRVLAGLGGTSARARQRFVLGGIAASLPAGTYTLESPGDPDGLNEAALGWLLAGYRFSRSAAPAKPKARLVAPEGVDAARLEAIAAGEALTRDLINTPANEMGPDEIEAAARTLAQTHDAELKVITGDALLAQNFPLIHTVGRASPRAPRLIELCHGSSGPTLTLVGKGVAFDTGGLNLKPGSSMGLMKKDMGGAATVLGLARMILTMGLPLRLRVLIPAVENSVSGNAFRPGDILTARNGKTIEINNTDAEGRLILADALALAAEQPPDLLVSMATLTGAARVAVGPDLAPFFTGDDGLAVALAQAGARVRDPVWRMPFHDPYETLIEPGIADLDNAPSGGMGGAITAALFLRRFTGSARYVHFDIYGWQQANAPARPKGGVGQGARALLEALPAVLGL